MDKTIPIFYHLFGADATPHAPDHATDGFAADADESANALHGSASGIGFTEPRDMATKSGNRENARTSRIRP